MTKEHTRKYIRFKPDVGSYAVIDFNSNKDIPFHGQALALIIDEAPMGGCSLVVLKDVTVNPGTECRIKLGAMAPLRSQCVWVKQLDEDIFRIGFKFLE